MKKDPSLLTRFEHKVYLTDTAVFGDLASILRHTMSADPDLGAFTEGERAADVGTTSTRLASAVATLLLRPQTVIGDREFLQLLVLSQTLKNLFLSSGYKGTDHILVCLGALNSESLRDLSRNDRQKFLKSLLLYSIDSHLDLDIKWLLSEEPKLGSLVYLGLLASKPVTTMAGHRRRDELLSLAPELIPYIPQSVDYLVILSNAWMLCSYASGPAKHGIKPVLNEYLRSWLKTIGCADAPLDKSREIVDLPRMVVAAEVMHSNHVQYRYFGQYLRQLRKRFQLILVTEEGQVDRHVSSLFDEVMTFTRSGHPAYLIQVRDMIVGARPDLVFWLSVGMRHWGTALANLRLAPIQLTALGHSSSTFSKQIDYYLTEEGYVGNPELFGERVLQLPDRSLRFERSPHLESLPCSSKPETNQSGVLRIALPSNLLKLNPLYIQTLRQIVDSVDRPISFYVFPNVSGVELMTTRRVLEEALTNVTVFPILRFQQYLTRLAECDVNLSPFPFGGLHSVIDSLRLGLPVIAMEGHEPHSRTDAMLLRRLGMPEWLITHSVQEYVSAARRVVSDDELRLQLKRQAMSISVDDVIFGDGSTLLGSDVADAVWWAYRNHERVLSSQMKLLTKNHWGS